jgi:serine/threonine protein kinase
MPSDVMDKWLRSGRSALVGAHRLKPIEHTCAKGKPLSSERGQAEAFFLTDERGGRWILKKFQQTCVLDPDYLAKVTALLPREPGFVCGTAREILAPGALQKATGCHYSRPLSQWLEGTILMPRVPGVDWACLADDVRVGQTVLTPPQRLNLCRNLTRLVELLETHQCCHRDVSCGNVFIEPPTGAVYLIDFDSFFHPGLSMPKATTCGTEGYTAPYAWVQGALDPRSTWCEKADRYALALLNVEMLLVRPGAEATGEGGLFRQEELKNRTGRGIDSITAELQTQYPVAAELLRQAIQSHTAADCPSPQAWNSFWLGMPSRMAAAIKLTDKPDYASRIADLLARRRPAAPLWPAPSLKDMPAAIPQLPTKQHLTIPVVPLPRDPWASGSTRRHIAVGGH